MNAVKTFYCDLCEQFFTTKQNRTRHRRIHTGEKPYECDICKKKFSRRNNLADHKRNHTGEKTYECDVCKKTFSQGSILAVHKRTHTGEKPYKCDVCKKTFSQGKTLAVHKRIHTGEKPYECDVCKKTFSHGSSLAKHIRIHTGLKPYECGICKKTFSQGYTLADHKRIHTGEKPYECEICQKSYAKRSDLCRHNKTAAHLNRKECKNTSTLSTRETFVDCGEAIKVENIKGEESVDDPLSFKGDISKCENENIVTEVKEVVIDDDSLSVQEIHNSGAGEINTVVNNIDIVKHKIKDSVKINTHEVQNPLANVKVNNMDKEVVDVMDKNEENVNMVEGNVVGQGNSNYQVLENLSVEEALAFFSS